MPWCIGEESLSPRQVLRCTGEENLSLRPVLWCTGEGNPSLRPLLWCTGEQNMSPRPVLWCAGKGNLSLRPVQWCTGVQNPFYPVLSCYAQGRRTEGTQSVHPMPWSTREENLSGGERVARSCAMVHKG